jgi:hypothetical protein
MSNSFWLLRPPNILVAGGIVVLFLAVIYTYIGKVWSRYHRGWVCRANEPKRYWFEVAMYYLLGLGMIGFFLYKVHAFSN